MPRRVRRASPDLDVPDWVLEYHPSPAFPTAQAWFLAVREYAREARLQEQNMTLWLHVMSNAYVYRRGYHIDSR